MRRIVVAVNSTPSTFGVAFNETAEVLEIISPCCEKPLEYQEASLPTGLAGAPRGVCLVVCAECRNAYRGYSNPTRPLKLFRNRYHRGETDWLEPWTGLTDTKVEITYE